MKKFRKKLFGTKSSAGRRYLEQSLAQEDAIWNKILCRNRHMEQNPAQEDAIWKRILHRKTISGTKSCAEKFLPEDYVAQEDSI